MAGHGRAVQDRRLHRGGDDAAAAREACLRAGGFPGLQRSAVARRAGPCVFRRTSGRQGRWARSRRASSAAAKAPRSEEHTSELQSLMRISYAVFCLKTSSLNISQHYHIIYLIIYLNVHLITYNT